MKQDKTAIPFDPDSLEPCTFHTSDAQVALEWCAVLASQKINFELSREGDDWLFKTAPGNFANAEKNINDYESEREFFNRHRQEFDTPPEPLKMVQAFPFIICGLFLYLFFVITGPVDSNREIFNRGMLSPEAFFKHGEWWRTVTSLTLHADYSHLLGNVLFLCLFATVAANQTGIGTSLFFIFISGIAGNITTIIILGEKSYNSLGASTVVFGALGIIAVLSVFRRKNELSLLRNFMLPMVSAIALLAFTGTAQGSDIIAHFMGFTWGAVFGVVINRLKQLRGCVIVQTVFFALTFLMIFYSWSLALK